MAAVTRNDPTFVRRLTTLAATEDCSGVLRSLPSVMPTVVPSICPTFAPVRGDTVEKMNGASPCAVFGDCIR